MGRNKITVAENIKVAFMCTAPAWLIADVNARNIKRSDLIQFGYDWITKRSDEYEALVIALGNNKNKIESLAALNDEHCKKIEDLEQEILILKADQSKLWDLEKGGK